MHPKIQPLLDLPPNWDSYGSPPPTREAGETASKILAELANPFICPVSSGGIQIEFRCNGQRVEIEIAPTGVVVTDEGQDP